jgi:hypothetical protein
LVSGTFSWLNVGVFRSSSHVDGGLRKEVGLYGRCLMKWVREGLRFLWVIDRLFDEDDDLLIKLMVCGWINEKR